MHLYSRFLELSNQWKALIIAAAIAALLGLCYGIYWVVKNRRTSWLPILNKKAATVAKKIAALKTVFTALERKVRHLMKQRDKLEAQVAGMTATNAQDAAEIEKLITRGEALIKELDAKP